MLVGEKADVEILILMKARPCAGESDQEIVAGAWDFKRINRGYSRYLRVLSQEPTIGRGRRRDAATKVLLSWATREREAWLNAVRNDPLLPAKILPTNYLGRRAWQRRMEVLRDAGQQLRSLTRS